MHEDRRVQHEALADLDASDLSRWLVQASPDGLWVFDERGTTVFANGRLGQLLGRTPEQMRGLSVFDCIDEQGKEDFARHLQVLATSRTPGSNLECRLLRGDGSDIWALVSHTPIKDDEGDHVGWLHRVTEYSEQRRLIDTLQHREQQLAEAQRIAKIGSWDWDLVTDEVTWSDELYRIYGVDPAEVPVPSVEAFFAILHPDDRETVGGIVDAAIARDEPLEFDCRIVQRDGSFLWIRGRGQVSRDRHGGAVRLGGTSQDVTATKDAEQALALLSAMATTANQANRLVDVVPTIIADVATHTGWRPVAGWMVDVDGTLQAVEGEVRPVDDHDRDESLRLALQAVQTRVPAVGRTSEGTTLVAAPIVAEERAACVIVMDSRVSTPPTDTDAVTIGQATALFARVAEREWTRERLAAARDDAMAASVAKSQFLATMSHEIRTPLNGVIGLSELLNRTELTERQRRLTDGIDNAGRQLLALVNDILDLSKIEAGRLELEQVDFDPRTVIEQSSTVVAEQARRKSLELVVSCQPDLPMAVCGDPVRFGQVIANLTSNAVKFTANGEVVVRASLERDAPDGAVVLRVEVTDTGYGMTPEVQDRLFTAFSQGDASTTREYGGTGLGLAICKQIVAAMGGEIGVTSARGRGSTFWFTAPFSPATNLPVPASIGTAIVSGLRVLVIDDNETNRFILEEQLGAWKVDTSLAASGVEGLSALDEAKRNGAPFDVVLLDYLMPGVNGEQFARMVRGDGRFADTRIILLTSSMDLNSTTLNDAGIDLALTKPVFASSLFDSLATVAASAPSSGSANAVRAAPNVPSPTGPSGRLGRVLVVEDNPVNQMVAVGILESLGYAASVAENGVVGVACFMAEPDGFDAILMDCQMPQMDGYEATRAIRAQEVPGSRIPIVAMTAAAIAGERERCLLAGMDDFLTKPVDVALLRSTLATWVTARADTRDEPDSAGVLTLPELIDDHAEVLDRDRLEELLDLEPGDPSMLLRFIDRFGTGSEQTMQALRQARDTGEAEQMGRAAHSLKGSSANLGATTLAALCKEVEDLGDEGRLVDDQVLDCLARERDRAVSALEGLAAALRSHD